MAWKGLHISQPARLSFADNQIVVAQVAGEARIALEDIAYVVLDESRVTLTARLLSACLDAGIVLVSTDARHTPNGVALPFHGHCRQAEIARAQIGMTAPFRKQCWRRVTRAKLQNQAAHLDHAGADGGALRQLAESVRSGDPDNVEARAARLYWKALFRDFRRDDDMDIRNMALNYAYAVLRAGVARSLVAHGFLPAIGVHHASGQNPFNLADDLIEPFRPFADAMVKQAFSTQFDDGEARLSVADRRVLSSVLFVSCAIGAWENADLMTAIDAMTASFLRAVETREPDCLSLPAFNRGAKKHDR